MAIKRNISIIILIAVFTLLFYSKSVICTDMRTSAIYSPDYNNIFWYVQISDVHIGMEDPNYIAKYEPNFKWLLTTAKNAIKPSFIVNTGDFVDASDPKDEYVSPLFLLLKYPPNAQQCDEWLKYEKYMKETNISTDEYYDVVGNHERYNDKNWNGLYDSQSKRFLGYCSTSIHGANTTPIGQFSWQKTLVNGDNYLFIATNTCDESGRAWSEYVNSYGLFGTVSDEPELSELERKYIYDELRKFYEISPSPKNKLTFIFGHAGIYRLVPKSINPFGEWNLNEISNGRGASQFIGLLNQYSVSAYSFGHTHKDRDFYDLNSFHDISTRLINTSSLTEQDMYRIVAVDNNGVSSRTFKVTKWPIVLITSPLEFTSKGFDISLNECTINNPYACTLKPSKDNFVRALAFSPQGLYKIEFRYKKNSLLNFFWSDWEEMKSVASNTYQAGWDCSSLENGEYKLEVRAQGAGDSEDSHTIIVKIDNKQCAFVYPNKGEVLREWLWLTATIDDELLNQTPTSGIKSALFYYSSDKIHWEPIYPAITTFNSKEIICNFKPDIKSGKLWFKVEIEVKNGLFSTYKTSDESENPVAIDNVPPTVPVLSVKSLKDGAIELKWTSAVDDNLAGYRIFRKAEDEAEQTLLYDGVTGNSLIDRFTENGKKYYYRMKAYDSSKGHSGKYPQ